MPTARRALGVASDPIARKVDAVGGYSDSSGILSTLEVLTPASAIDGDGDGVPDTIDNCPAVANPGQEDLGW